MGRHVLALRDDASMSWDIYVQRLPDGVRHVEEIPSDFAPGPLGPRAAVVAGIEHVFPDVDFTDPEWGLVERDALSIEIHLRAADPVMSFALHVRGGDDAASAVGALLEHLDVQALDPQSSSGIFGVESAAGSVERWQAYRDRVLDGRPPDA